MYKGSKYNARTEAIKGSVICHCVDFIRSAENKGQDILPELILSVLRKALLTSSTEYGKSHCVGSVTTKPAKRGVNQVFKIVNAKFLCSFFVYFENFLLQ